MGADHALLDVQGLSRAFVSPAGTVRAVKDVSFTARAGQLVCVHGASGSGKSTLVNLLSGLLVPDAGRILVDSVSIGGTTDAERSRLRLDTIGVVFQDVRLIEEFTVLENVALPLEARRISHGDAFRRAAEALDEVGLSGVHDRFPATLSGGQCQRVGIARALVGGQRLLLADEPTGALDSKTSREMFELFRALCHKGVLVVVCSHDPLCLEFADVAVEMSDGRLRIGVTG